MIKNVVGVVAHLVEHPLGVGEARGSKPCNSNFFLSFFLFFLSLFFYQINFHSILFDSIHIRHYYIPFKLN